MPVTWESVSSAGTSATGDTTCTVPKPTGLASGDLLVAVCGSADPRTPSLSGWTQLSTDTNGTSRNTVLYRVADSTDAAASNIVFSTGGGFSQCVIGLARITGADTTGIVAASAFSPNDVTYTGPAITPPAANSLILWAQTQTAAAGPGASTRGTEVLDQNFSVSSCEGWVQLSHESVASTSSQTGPTFTKTTYGVAAGRAIAIAPSGGDTTPPTLVSPTVPSAGTTLTATLSESGCTPASGTGGFTIAGTSATVASWAISGTTLTLTLSGTVQSGQTVTYSYDRATTTNDIADAAGNFLANFTGVAATNNSTQTGPLTAGTASFVSSGIAGIIVTATNSTGGTLPYTYQWQRNASGGSYANISNGGGVSGATALTITDDSGSLGTLYGYRLVYTDNVAATVTSNAVTAQVYEGGAIGSGGGRASVIGG